MKVVIFGSRSIEESQANIDLISKALKEMKLVPTLIISGAARGGDILGEKWAKQNKCALDRCPANWDLYGKRAGFIRNKQMCEKADAGICFWDEVSRGTSNMLQLCKEKGISVALFTQSKGLEII